MDIHLRAKYYTSKGESKVNSYIKANADMLKIPPDERFSQFKNTNVSQKGVTLCNVSACQSPDYVMFHNISTKKLYCLHCAIDIREANMYMTDLFPDFNTQLDLVLKQEKTKNDEQIPF